MNHCRWTSWHSGLCHKKNSSMGGAAWEGLAWEGLAWEGLAWKGLAWEGLAWKGLAWETDQCQNFCAHGLFTKFAKIDWKNFAMYSTCVHLYSHMSCILYCLHPSTLIKVLVLHICPVTWQPVCDVCWTEQWRGLSPVKGWQQGQLCGRGII